MNDRTILHIDMNNFYASVECLYRPELKNVPMAVAGDPEKRHGIILAKNQLAKEKGVQTAEAIWQSQLKCKDLVLVPPNHQRYAKFSKLAMDIYSEYTDQVESYGLDECWLDVSGSSRLFGTGMEIAEQIRQRIKDELGLTVSIGVSFNKIFAKLGSDYKKPDAVTQITRENYKEIVWNLPTKELLYVGKSTKKVLDKFGVKTIGEIAQIDKEVLGKNLGKAGYQLWNFANALDDSPVTSLLEHHEVKNIVNSTTLPKDIKDENEIKKVFFSLSEQVAHRLRKRGLWAVGLQITVKKYNLESYQKSCTLPMAVADSQSIFKYAYKLFKDSDEKSSVRSLGVRVDRLSKEPVVQYNIFEKVENLDKEMKLEDTKDKLRAKYGLDSLKRAILYEKED